MGDTARKAIDNWCRCLTRDETLRYTQALGLKRNGGTFRKLERLNKWLVGDYEPEEFVEMAAADEHTAWVQRANARRTFLDRTSGSDHDISWANSTSDEPHPLEVLKTGEVVQQNLERSREWATQASREERETAEDETVSNDENNNRNADASGQNTANARPTMFEMSMADGTTLQVPTDWTVYMAAVDKKLDQIEESTRLMVNSMHHPNANSTRRNSAEGIRRVTFTDRTTADRSDENLREAGSRSAARLGAR